jgi:hypothetical protein
MQPLVFSWPGETISSPCRKTILAISRELKRNCEQDIHKMQGIIREYRKIIVTIKKDLRSDRSKVTNNFWTN